MEYNIRVFKIDKQNSNLRGFVSITFEESFCVKDIALKESTKGGLYLEMPKYKDYETEDYVPYYTIRNADFRKQLSEEVVDACSQIREGEKMADIQSVWGDEELYYDLSINPNPHNDTFKADVAMRMQDVFIVQQMHVIQGWNGKIFVGMPQRNNSQKKEKEDIAHPVSADFKSELEETILGEYHKKIEQQQKKQAQPKPK